MNKIENYLGVANHDIQMANNSQELKSYVASILYENDELQQENQQLKSVIKEIRECIKEKEKDGTLWTVKSTDEILEMLDKYQEGKHE